VNSETYTAAAIVQDWRFILEAVIKQVWRCTLEAVIQSVCRCTSRPQLKEFGDAFGGRDRAPLDMHLEAIIGIVERYT